MVPQQDEQAGMAYAELGLFMHHELAAMTENVVNNYAENMANRENNPFLSFRDSQINKYMALGRSVDSQLGNRMQRIIFRTARIKYGLLHVPNIVAIDVTNEEARNIVCTLYSVPCVLRGSEQNKGFNPYGQVIYVDLHKSDSDIKRILKIKSHSNALQQASYSFGEIDEDTFQYIKSNVGQRIPVDLLFFDCADAVLNNANAFEIKMGGNLDTKNAKSNAQEVKDLSRLFGFLPSNFAYFATCYGTCSSSVSTDLNQIMGDGAVLNGRAFWDKVIPATPETFNYEDFIAAYRQAFLLSNIEARLREL